MKRAASYIIVLVIGAAAGAAGYWRLFEYGRQPEIRIVEKTKIVSVPVSRDYSAMRRENLTGKLTCYDTAEPKLDAEFRSGTAYLSAGLCERTWTREIRYEVGSSGNWRYFVGGACAAGAVAGGFMLWRAVR